MKRIRRALCLTFAFLTVLSCCNLGSIAMAANEENAVQPCATGTFNLSVQANSFATSSSSFSLEKGEKVSIEANCSPADADIDCGVVDEDGAFYCISSKNGSVNGSITIRANGTYKLAVVNNSSFSATVVGIVRY